MYMSECQGFSFNGKHSNEFEGIAIKSISRPLGPSLRVSKETIPGKHGSYIFEDGYDNEIIPVECFFMENDYRLRRQILRNVAAWLSRKGNLIFDDEPDKYYKARIYNLGKLLETANYDGFTLLFECHPLAYSTYINEYVVLDNELVLYNEMPLGGLQNNFQVTSNMTVSVTNLGTFEATPMVEIEGTADLIVISTGDSQFSIQNITQKVYIDCERMICYTLDGDGKKQNKLMDFTGDFIKLLPGENSITIEGVNMNCNVFLNFRNTYL